MATVKLFAILREKAGVGEIEVPLNGSNTVRDLLDRLQRDYPAIAPLIASIEPRVAVNHEFVNSSDPVSDTDEIALIPPVSGGGGPISVDGGEVVRVQRQDFSVDQAIAQVKAASTRIGGVTVFLGTARDFSRDREVAHLEFEHYPGMAEAKLKEIRQRALDDFDVTEVLILHRYGRIETGDNIVLIVVGAPHRDQAFKACRFCIDELKHITPIWKKEVTPSGDFWVEEHP